MSQNGGRCRASGSQEFPKNGYIYIYKNMGYGDSLGVCTKNSMQIILRNILYDRRYVWRKGMTGLRGSGFGSCAVGSVGLHFLSSPVTP